MTHDDYKQLLTLLSFLATVFVGMKLMGDLNVSWFFCFYWTTACSIVLFGLLKLNKLKETDDD